MTQRKPSDTAPTVPVAEFERVARQRADLVREVATLRQLVMTQGELLAVYRAALGAAKTGGRGNS